MIRAIASIHINATPERVFSLYADPRNWPAVFPATIRGVRIVRESGDEKVVEVDHRYEGKVINVLVPISARRIQLREFKRGFDAEFQNLIEPEAAGTRYTVRTEVRLKGISRLAAPLVKPLAISRIRRYVLEPMKTAAEKRAGT